MSYRTDRAAELFKSGFNCSQAVLGSFCEEYDVSLEAALKIACGLGSGMRSAEVCGAVSGAILVVGLKYGTYDCEESKDICNNKTEELSKNGCRCFTIT